MPTIRTAVNPMEPTTNIVNGLVGAVPAVVVVSTVLVSVVVSVAALLNVISQTRRHAGII